MAATAIYDGIPCKRGSKGGPRKSDCSSSVLGNSFCTTVIDEKACDEVCSDMATNHLPRVLVVEDSPSNQKVTTHMLQRLGYNFDVVTNGFEALQVMERNHYDVILMNVRMPVMDGLEATRRIRRQFPENRQPYIIALTAYVVPGAREKCLEAGMDDYLPKPVRLSELEKALGRCKP